MQQFVRDLNLHAFLIEDQEGAENKRSGNKKQCGGVRFMDSIASRKLAEDR
jgi:hypothetical protein